MDAVRYLLERGFKIQPNKGEETMCFSKLVHQTMMLIWFFDTNVVKILFVGFTRWGAVEFYRYGIDIKQTMQEMIEIYNKSVIGSNLTRCVILNENTIEPMKTSDGLPIMADD